MSARDVALFDIEEACVTLGVEDLRFVASFAWHLRKRCDQLRTALEVSSNPILVEATLRTSLGIAGYAIEARS